MNRTSIAAWLSGLVVGVALGAGCSAGPDQPIQFHPPAFHIKGQFRDFPAEPVTSMTLTVGVVGSCNSSGSSGEVITNPTYYAVQSVADFQLVEKGFDALVTSYGFATLALSNCTPLGDASGRFFNVVSQLYAHDQPQSLGAWRPRGHQPVFGRVPFTFRPFGPAGASVNVPPGYSWLRRSCSSGMPGVTMDVVSTDETVEFERFAVPASDSTTVYHEVTFEQSELDFLKSCGLAPPATDMGVRVSFDEAAQMVWTPDGGTLHYLAKRNADSAEHLVGLRALLVDARTSAEIAAVPFAHALAADRTGQLFVADESHWNLVARGSDGQTMVRALPVPTRAMLAPNGRWFAYDEWKTEDGWVVVWDIAAGKEITRISGYRLGWSADSLVAVRVPTGVVVQSVVPPMMETSYAFGDAANATIFMTSRGPIAAKAPLDWYVFEPAEYPIPTCNGCFGLSLREPSTTDWRPVLEPSGGQIDFVPSPPDADFILVWQRLCLGLYNTVCPTSLLQIRVADGMSRTLAVAPARLPFALSPDGHRVAFAGTDGIYVKEIP